MKWLIAFGVYRCSFFFPFFFLINEMEKKIVFLCKMYCKVRCLKQIKQIFKLLKIKIFSSFNVNALGLCVSWAHSYMNEIFMLARVRVNVMVDDCNLLFLLSCEKQKSVCCMTLKQSNNIFIGLSGNFFMPRWILKANIIFYILVFWVGLKFSHLI